MGLNRSTLAEQIYDQLKSDILFNRIPAGKKISLKDLQEQYEVSSTVGREALIRLSQDKLVEYTTNIGATVIELSKHDIMNIFDLAVMFDVFAAKKIIESPDRNKIVDDLSSHLESQVEYNKKGNADIVEYESHVGGFHAMMYNACGNTWMVDYASQCCKLLNLAYMRMQIELGGDMSFPDDSIHEHEMIIAALKSGNADEAEEAVRSHRQKELERYQLALDKKENR